MKRPKPPGLIERIDIRKSRNGGWVVAAFDNNDDGCLTGMRFNTLAEALETLPKMTAVASAVRLSNRLDA